MKKILLSMLAIAALASCSKSENTSEVNFGDLVAIRLGAGVQTSTKAPVTSSATVQIEGWENASTEGYTTASTWQSTALVTVAASAADITLSTVRYYNADQSITTYIKGWYPAVASAFGVVTFTTNDGGTEDVLLSNVVSGTKASPVAADMIFAHQTAQLLFKVIKGVGLAAGTQIKSITVKGAKVPTAITLANNVVTYSDKGDLSVPNITAAEITATAAQAGDPLMIEPVADNSTLKLDIETVKADGTPAATYTDVTFTTDGSKLIKGTAYTVTLTFAQSGISVSANITPWAEAGGTGTVQ